MNDVDKLKKKVNEPYGWLKIGLSWGLFMFVFVGIIMAWAFDDPINQTTLIKSAIQWLIAGLIFGFVTVKLLWPFLIKRMEKKEAERKINE